jgi:hypothetical protein
VTTSAVLILPALHQNAGNQLAIAMGHDEPPGRTYCVPLSPTGSYPATHYGCHAWVTEGFVQTLAGAAQGNVPDGLDGQLVATVLGNLISSMIPADQVEARPHFDSVLTANGLQQIHDDL